MAERSLESLKDRLEKAVTRLESDSGKSGAASGVASAAISATISEEIESLRAENAALQDASHSVSIRLDQAIERIRGILDA